MGNIEIKRVQWFSFRNHKDSGCVKTINLSCKSLFSSFKNYDRLLNFSELSRAYKLTTLTWKNLCFTEFSTKIHWNTVLAASDVFHMFTQSIKFFLFHLWYRCLKNVIHQIDSENEWLLLSVTFTAKFQLAFVLTIENSFF